VTRKPTPYFKPYPPHQSGSDSVPCTCFLPII